MLGRSKLLTKSFGLLQFELFGNLLTGAPVRGSGQCDPGDLGKALMQDGKLLVILAEIMSPLGYAVGLVDGEQRRLRLLQEPERPFRQQAFRGKIEQVQFILQQLLFDLSLLRLRPGSNSGRRRVCPTG